MIGAGVKTDFFMSRLSVGDNEGAVEMDDGDSCTTRLMYLLPWTVQLERVKTVSSMQNVLYHKF